MTAKFISLIFRHLEKT